MQYCKTIRRILAIDSALDRVPQTPEKYDDICDRLIDKRDNLVNTLKEYKRNGNRPERRKQLSTACRLLKTTLYSVMHLNH